MEEPKHEYSKLTEIFGEEAAKDIVQQIENTLYENFIGDTSS